NEVVREQLIETDQQAIEADRRFQQERDRLLAAAATAREDYQAATTSLDRHADEFARLRQVGLPILGILLGLLAAILLMTALWRHVVQALPYYAGAAVCVILLVGLVLLAQANLLTFASAGPDSPVVLQNAEERVLAQGKPLVPEARER